MVHEAAREAHIARRRESQSKQPAAQLKQDHNWKWARLAPPLSSPPLVFFLHQTHTHPSHHTSRFSGDEAWLARLANGGGQMRWAIDMSAEVRHHAHNVTPLLFCGARSYNHPPPGRIGIPFTRL